MGTDRIGIDGVDDFMKALDDIGDKVALKVIKKASEQAAIPLLAETKAQCPIKTGNLREALFLQKKQQKKKGFAGCEVKATKGKTAENDAWYAQLVEFGHKDKAGHHVPAQPFFSRAVEIKKSEVLNMLSDNVKAGIEQAAEKWRAKAESRKNK
jgi:HK97 gp10 family phage protein